MRVPVNHKQFRPQAANYHYVETLADENIEIQVSSLLYNFHATQEESIRT